MALLRRAGLAPRAAACWLALAVLAPLRVAAQQQSTLEYRVKAAYLLNFMRYVQWPADAFVSPDDPIRVCVVGDDPFGTALEATLAGRTAQQRLIALDRVDGPAQARDCHLVFISEEEWRRRPDLLAAVRAYGVLTVGEGSDFARSGGVLSFVPVGRTVRFAVNLDARDGAGLQISSRMLALAAELHGERRRAAP